PPLVASSGSGAAAQQSAHLEHDLLSGAERQHRHAYFFLPCQHVGNAPRSEGVDVASDTLPAQGHFDLQASVGNH
ncbi:hypothetical protein, partial [Salmonella sp. SAL4357]|uniref:hypothetical protein n=1 Tax=Salmonella sp. SAL4357 TaxID=3159878 RepID=UPI00397A11C2